MSISANYASTVRSTMSSLSAANTNRDGTGTLAISAVAGIAGSRVDKLSVQALGTTTAGMIRLFRVKGSPGAPILSITFATTTATIKTTVPHGRATGELLTLQGAFPDTYNIQGAPITVTAADTFTVTLPSAPTAVATTMGWYFTTPAVISAVMVKEILVNAVTPSGTLPAYSLSAVSGVDVTFLPLMLAPGESLRTSTNNAESFSVYAQIGDF